MQKREIEVRICVCGDPESEHFLRVDKIVDGKKIVVKGCMHKKIDADRFCRCNEFKLQAIVRQRVD